MPLMVFLPFCPLCVRLQRPPVVQQVPVGERPGGQHCALFHPGALPWLAHLAPHPPRQPRPRGERRVLVPRPPRHLRQHGGCIGVGSSSRWRACWVNRVEEQEQARGCGAPAAEAVGDKGRWLGAVMVSMEGRWRTALGVWMDLMGLMRTLPRVTRLHHPPTPCPSPCPHHQHAPTLRHGAARVRRASWAASAA